MHTETCQYIARRVYIHFLDICMHVLSFAPKDQVFVMLLELCLKVSACWYLSIYSISQMKTVLYWLSKSGNAGGQVFSYIISPPIAEFQLCHIS